ncbi:hypothetical protein KGO06_01320 [Patescibacteria group bacterium]|nr:hypothetical protein [Patescibacteria group bacterium]
MDERKLEEMYQLVRENNAMLRSQRRSAFIHSVITFVWWVVLLVVVPAVSWLYLEPYLTAAQAQYRAVQETGASLQSEAKNIESQVSGIWDLLRDFGIQP